MPPKQTAASFRKALDRNTPEHIREQGTAERVEAIEKFLDEAHAVARGIDGKLFGKSLLPGEIGATEDRGIDGKLAKISTEAACLVGLLRTIDEKLG